MPGGGANVARNLCTLGARVTVFGMVGDDLDGQELLTQLHGAGADASQVVFDQHRPTTVKTRVLAGNQQVVRIDSEQTNEASSAIRKKLLCNLENSLRGGDIQALILEDYAKGLFNRKFIQQVISLAESYGVLGTLDPHPSHAFNVHGLQLMTPNRSEAFTLAKTAYQGSRGDALHDQKLLRVGQRLQKNWQPAHLLITLGGDGMLLLSGRECSPIHIPTKAKQVFDVSGAGDTVMATMVLAMLAGATMPEAAEIANHAAGIVVGLVGTAAVEIDSLTASLSSPC